MRIACFGWVEPACGSVASANFVLLETLLNRGHEIHLFGEHGFVNPARLLGRAGYAYKSLAPRVTTGLARQGQIPPVVMRALGEAAFPGFVRSLGQVISEAHVRYAYDVLVFLGTPAFCRVPGLPVVEWVQGCPQEEAAAFRRRKRLVVAASGWSHYLLYSAHYRFDQIMSRFTTVDADLTICTSRWTRDALESYGHSQQRIAILPYPIDFEFFALGGSRPVAQPRILHLGRCDPRKRIDLLVASFRLVRDRLPMAELIAVGSPGVVPGIVDMFSAPDLAGHAWHVPSVPRDQVPELLQNADILVQTSEGENFGSSVAEALACGTPVVVGAANGTADYIDSRSEMFLAYTAKAIAEAILTVLERTRGEDVGARGRRRIHAMRLLSPEAVAQRFEELVGEICRVRRAGVD